jgi:DNA ligase 1
MRDFAELLDRLLYTRSRNDKIALIAAYLKTTPDPDRGWALAALTGDLDLKAVQPSLIRALMESRVDPVLFKLSYDYVGDLAETCALLWPTEAKSENKPLAETVSILSALTRAQAPAVVAIFLDGLDATGRWAFLKLAMGGLRVGVNARLAKTAAALAFSIDLEEIEEIWHGLTAPYAALFAWGDGKTLRPHPGNIPVFRPFMLAHPLEAGKPVSVADYVAEWKWDGIRVQVVRAGGDVRVYSRTGDDISASFPEIAKAMTRDGTVDGELLVRDAAQGVGTFNALQQRLGRKTPTAAHMKAYPAFVRLYDILFDGTDDVRGLTLMQRRVQLSAFVQALAVPQFDLSDIIDVDSWEQLAVIRAGAREAAQEGLMLKLRESAYVAGRKVGQWYKWKRDPLVADCVMMYAQRGHGKRSSYYSDFTFGAWDEAGNLLPVGKAYFGFTDAELRWLDKFVRDNTTNKFGPVREVAKTLVLEVAFDAMQDSGRHKSGLAMRFPRISRIRSDKPATEADTLVTLRKLVGVAKTSS